VGFVLYFKMFHQNVKTGATVFFFSRNISVIHRRKKVMQVCDDVRVN